MQVCSSPGRLRPGTPCTALLLLLCAAALAPVRAQAPDSPAAVVAGRSGGAQATPRAAGAGCTTVCDEKCSVLSGTVWYDYYACLSDPGLVYTPNTGINDPFYTPCTRAVNTTCPLGLCMDGVGADTLAAQLAVLHSECAKSESIYPAGYKLQQSTYNCVEVCPPAPPSPPPPPVPPPLLPVVSGGQPSGEPAPSQPTPGPVLPSAPTLVGQPAAPGCDMVCDQYCSSSVLGPQYDVYACLSDPLITYVPKAGDAYGTTCTGGGASVGCANGQCFDGVGNYGDAARASQLSVVNFTCTSWMTSDPAKNWTLKNSSFHCAQVCPTPVTPEAQIPAPPAPIAFTASVSVTFGLGGVNASAFGDAEKMAFRAALAITLSLPDLSFAVVDSVVDAPGRRRLTQSGAVSVATTVLATAATQGALQGQLSALQADKSGLTAALATTGLRVSVTSMSAPVWRALAAVPAPPGPPPASKVAYIVSSAIAIAGYAAPSVTPAQLRGFSAGLAATLRKSAADVPIVGRATPSQRLSGRRRVLADAAAVAFNVRAATRREADTVVFALLSSGTMDVLASNLQGTFPGVKGSDLSLEAPPAMFESAAPLRAGALAACAAALLAAALITL